MSSKSGSGAESGPNDVFDVRKVRRFIELMNEYDLAEIDLRQADQRIRLRRGPDMAALAPPSMSASAPIAPAPAVSAAANATPTVLPKDDSKALLIRSPMVGTFYSAANPEAPSFVKVGDQIGPETIVCIVEAMKVFNEIPAECSGRIVAVLVQSGDAVEFNQPLFRVEPGS